MSWDCCDKDTDLATETKTLDWTSTWSLLKTKHSSDQRRKSLLQNVVEVSHGHERGVTVFSYRIKSISCMNHCCIFTLVAAYFLSRRELHRRMDTSSYMTSLLKYSCIDLFPFLSLSPIILLYFLQPLFAQSYFSAVLPLFLAITFFDWPLF